jgi:hypothetical protein
VNELLRQSGAAKQSSGKVFLAVRLRRFARNDKEMAARPARRPIGNSRITLAQYTKVKLS